jgi:hypothetical protein
VVYKILFFLARWRIIETQPSSVRYEQAGTTPVYGDHNWRTSLPRLGNERIGSAAVCCTSRPRGGRPYERA